MRDRVGVVVVTVISLGGLLFWGVPGFAGEHGGKEHAGEATTSATKEHGGDTQEHGGKSVKTEPSAEQIRQTIRDYVNGIEERDGAFTIGDKLTETTRTLTFVRVHERVGKTGELYYSCTDMRDTSTGELLDLDFDIESKDGNLNVVDERIHKVEGQARYTYDEEDNRISLL